MVLLPGLDGTGRFFKPLLAKLGSGVRPIVVTYPAHQVLGYADLVSIVEQQLPRGLFVLVGESFSGPLAIEIVVRNADRVIGLVLVAISCAARSGFPGCSRHSSARCS